MAKKYSKLNTIIYWSITGAAIIGIGLGVALPWLKTIDKTPTVTSYEDQGEKTDHIFEYEEGVISGNSANTNNYWDHFCKNKSFTVHPLFSGGLCMRNISQLSEDASKGFKTNNPTNTFTFTSDHKYSRLELQICIASKYSGSEYQASSLGAVFTNVTMNDKKLAYSNVQVPSSVSKINAGNYFNMHVVTIQNVKIEEGKNVLKFYHANGFLNIDYINLRTSAKIDFTPTINLDPKSVNVSKEPTNATTGTCTIACDHSGCGNKDAYTLPKLTTDVGYEVVPATGQSYSYNFKVGTKQFTYTSAMPQGRKVGDEHNELKAGKTASILRNDKDFFFASNWTADDRGTQQSWTKEDIIDKDGNVVIENTTEKNTSARFPLLYFGKDTNDAWVHYYHAGDRTDLLTHSMYKTAMTYTFTVNANGPFRLTFGGVAGSALDLSVTNQCITAFDFGSDGKISVRNQDYNADFRTPTDAQYGTPEIVSSATGFEFNKDQTLTFKLSRYDAPHLAFRIYVNGKLATFTSSISDTTRGKNLYVKEGNFVFANKLVGTAHGGQRFGVMPDLDKWFVIKDLTWEETSDNWNPSK